VAVVGRPNVGKSTLFNRLVGKRLAIVHDEPGVTRDRLYGVVRRENAHFRLVDTGGLTPSTEAPFAREIERQAEAALAEAALILFVADTRAGLTAVDREVAAWLRRRGAPVVVVGTKVETPAVELLAAELYELGLGEPILVSAEHGLGIDALLDAIVAKVGTGGEPAATEPTAIRLAIVGRPNVGKSSIVNRLLGEERVVVSDVPGTTRDAIDTAFERDGRRYVIVDTAGLRRRGRERETAETLSVVIARRAIARADVVALVLDGTQSVAAQDAHIAGDVRDAGKPFLVVVNKWDVVEDREVRAKAWEAEVRERLRFAKEVPVIFVSALTGQRVAKVLERVDAVHAAAGIRVSTPELNRWLQEVAEDERAAPARGRSIRLRYVTQTGVHPPRFVLFCNDARHVHFSLRRHLENSLRERFGFGPAPIVLTFRSRVEGRKR
jgi:GTP-binding protein